MEPDEDRHDRADREIEQRADQLWALTRALAGAEPPDLGLLSAAGFETTGQTARHGTGQPRVVFLLPADGRPEQGHNLIAAACIGAALATASTMTSGTIVVTDHPLEADAVLTFQPGARTWPAAALAARAELRVAMHGNSGSTPEDNTDALAGLLQVFTAVGALRARLPRDASIRGIVTHGGESTETVPDYAEAHFGLRAPDRTVLSRLIAELTTIAEGAALATGTKTDVARIGPEHAHFQNNSVLSRHFAQHLSACGIHPEPPPPSPVPGRPQVGDLSHRFPTIHPTVALRDPLPATGSRAFAEATRSPRARTLLLATAAALARTAADLLAHPALARQAQDDFAGRKRATG